MKQIVKRSKHHIIGLVCLLLAFNAQSQIKVGGNTSTISPAAELEIESTTKGLLLPRLSTAERDLINSPALGLVIYNTTTNCVENFNGIGWYNRCNGMMAPPVGGNPSSGGTAVISAWTSLNGCNVGAGTNNNPAGIRQGGVNQTMVRGVSTSVSGNITITLEANVTTVGTYNIFTNTVNGVSFYAVGSFTGSPGIKTVTFVANGTPSLAGNFMWQISRTPSINIYGSVITTMAPLGNTYNAHFNGITNEVSIDHTLSTYASGEVFSNNTTCTSQHISAQGCGGIDRVIGTSGRIYPTININGQCWLQRNLNDVPSVYNNYTTTSWTNTLPGDQGYWGYYHTTTTNGTSGWQATEPATNEGLLYQWCGAMNATISERSLGACPTGFHVPSDCEWMFLEHGQGMSITEQNKNFTWRANSADNEGTPGNKLRSQGTWQTNASGFSVLLVGIRSTYGSFDQRTSYCYLWSSSATGTTTASTRLLVTNWRGVYRYAQVKDNGFSVRCLKD